VRPELTKREEKKEILENAYYIQFDKPWEKQLI